MGDGGWGMGDRRKGMGFMRVRGEGKWRGKGRKSVRGRGEGEKRGEEERRRGEAFRIENDLFEVDFEPSSARCRALLFQAPPCGVEPRTEAHHLGIRPNFC
jgi:hypothetical protein